MKYRSNQLVVYILADWYSDFRRYMFFAVASNKACPMEKREKKKEFNMPASASWPRVVKLEGDEFVIN